MGACSACLPFESAGGLGSNSLGVGSLTGAKVKVKKLDLFMPVLEIHDLKDQFVVGHKIS